jgi:hypothetical protein
MVDRMLELGDVEGRDLWRRIRRAIEALQAVVSTGSELCSMVTGRKTHQKRSRKISRLI